jgi:hypothetical protein
MSQLRPPGQPSAGRRWRRIAALVAGVLLAVGCGPSQPPGPKIGVDVGLKRGGSWTTFNVRPARLVGSTASIEFKKGQAFGFLNNESVNLQIKADELTGTAGGRVALDVDSADGRVEISGTWNDDRVHFVVTPDSLKGTITGAAPSLMGGGLGHCQYVLDKMESDGARTGVSICSGMPEPTRLEFPSAVEKWLGRGEVVVVLLALLASAPPTSTDF